MTWPETEEALRAAQEELGRGTPEPWTPPPGALAVGGVFVCFERGRRGPGKAGDAG